MAIKLWNGKPLSLKVIGTNAGTSMDGLDIAHIHYTQESPDAPLKMRLLRAGEVAFDGELKSEYCERLSQEVLLMRLRAGHAPHPNQQNIPRRDLHGQHPGM
jgi:hypothetical protein